MRLLEEFTEFYVQFIEVDGIRQKIFFETYHELEDLKLYARKTLLRLIHSVKCRLRARFYFAAIPY